MKVNDFVQILGADFFVGVPDSQLKPLCNYLMCTYGIDPKHHIISANEGTCTALAAGYNMATGKVPVVYMQNSGEGNIINPVASLLNKKVYAIPMIFVIGWRGEPGVKDEPQHIYQGEITLRLLEDMNISYFVLDKETSVEDFTNVVSNFKTVLSDGESVAFVVKKNALFFDENIDYNNEYSMTREEIIKHVINASADDPIISTTGKASRELFELREGKSQGHKRDFLTVGSMGHASSIALGIALQKPEKRIWCIDGDGAMIMHMGAMGIIGAYKPKNLIHIVINNEAHETVGGLPTVSKHMDMVSLALSCGYQYAVCVSTYEELDEVLKNATSKNVLSFIEVKSAIGARASLGRPTTTPIENKLEFMKFLSE